MWKITVGLLWAGALCGYAGLRSIVEGRTENGILLLVMGAALLGGLVLLRRFR